MIWPVGYGEIEGLAAIAMSYKTDPGEFRTGRRGDDATVMPYSMRISVLQSAQ